MCSVILLNVVNQNNHLMCIAFAKAFGKGTGYGIGLAFLGFIFFPMLGFSDATYTGAPAA